MPWTRRLAIHAVRSRELIQDIQNPFNAGLLFVAACLLLIGFVYLRNHIQRLVTRVIFLRANVDETLGELRDLGGHRRVAGREQRRVVHQPRQQGRNTKGTRRTELGSA